MSNFVWKADEDQYFNNSYATTTLSGGGKEFSKDIGHNFIMDASSRVLTLKVNDRNNIFWPNENFSKQGNVFRILNGKLIIEDPQSVIIGGPENNDPLRLDLDIKGELHISAKLSVQMRTHKANMAKMLISENGVLTIKCAETYCYSRLELSNQARVEIDTLQVTCQKTDMPNLLTNFSLSDNAKLIFKNTDSAHQDVKPFDFFDRDYPENIFSFLFKNDIAENKATLFIDKITGSSQFSAMLGRKIISINNNMDFTYLNEHLAFRFADGGIYITLK